jgi:hypothetical protein
MLLHKAARRHGWLIEIERQLGEVAALRFKFRQEGRATALNNIRLVRALLFLARLRTSYLLLLPGAALCSLLSHSLTDHTHFYILNLAF